MIVRGDARRLPLADGSVSVIVTSPPYFALRSYRDDGEHFDGQIGSEETPAAFVEALLVCAEEWRRVLRPDGCVWVNLGDTYSRGQRLDSELTVADAAWLAGVIDCDGSISIHQSQPKDGLRPSWVPWVRVGQMDPEVVKRCHAVTGQGTVRQDKRGVWTWAIATRQADWVLRRVCPWLHIKQRQALAAIALQAHKNERRNKGSHNPLTDDDVRYRTLVRDAVLDWNQGRPNEWEPPLVDIVALPTEPKFVRPKSMMGMPWRFALAMIDSGWILRSDVIWKKPNGLPISVTDRVRTEEHEYWFMFTKEPRYFSALDELRMPYADDRQTTTGRSWDERKATGERSGNREADSLTLTGHVGTLGEANPLGRLPGSVQSVPTEPLSPGPIYDCDESYGAGKTIGGYDAPWPMPDHRIMLAKDLWPWLWHLVGLGLESYVVGPHVDHFAAFPQAWPEWILTGFAPLRGICVVCDEGLRPVVEKDIDPTYKGGRIDVRGGSGSKDLSEPEGNERGINATGSPIFRQQATITGYACPCGPEGTTPTRPPLVLDPFGGTGTVAGVARKLGANAISVDLSHDYSRLAAYLLTTARYAKSERKAWERRQGSLL